MNQVDRLMRDALTGYLEARVPHDIDLGVQVDAKLTQLPRSPRRGRLAVLVLAHNEEALVGRCVASLRDQTYPRSRYRVIVIADNCTDRTAESAAIPGVEVFERHDDARRGQYHALCWAMDQLRAEPEPIDGVVFVNADSVADRDLLRHLGTALDEGADFAQAQYVIVGDRTSRPSRLFAAASRLLRRVHLSRPAIRPDNGVVFSRRLWDAFAGAEGLRRPDFRPRLVAAARILGPSRRTPASRRTHAARGMKLPLAEILAASSPIAALVVAWPWPTYLHIVVGLAGPFAYLVNRCLLSLLAWKALGQMEPSKVMELMATITDPPLRTPETGQSKVRGRTVSGSPDSPETSR